MEGQSEPTLDGLEGVIVADTVLSRVDGARVAGWLAHIEEQGRTGRSIRPMARYVGPAPEAA